MASEFKIVGNLATVMQTATWDDVIGQKQAKQVLFGMFKSKNIKQTFLFHGERGIGKTSMIRLLAATLNCAHPDASFNPCGECKSCKLMFSSANPNHPDYQEIDCAANGLIDNTRRIMDHSANRPQFNFRVICLDEAQMMGKPAQSSLLKTLQAPKPHVVFAIATTDPQNILDTINSRCVQLGLRKPSTAENIKLMRGICAENKMSIPKEVLSQITMNAENHTRDCINMLGSVMDGMRAEAEPMAPEALSVWVSELLGATPWKLVHKFCSSMLTGDSAMVIESMRMSASRVQFIKSVLLQLANVIVYNANPMLLESYTQRNTDELMKLVPGKTGFNHLLDLTHDLSEIYARIQGYAVDAEASCLPTFVRYARKFRVASKALTDG